MDKFKQINITRLKGNDAEPLSKLLLSAPKEYSQYFIPFDFGRETISKILTEVRQDQFYGIYVGNTLAGFYMLRGFDQGYRVPSYGVWISPQFSGMGLASLTLQHAMAFCRANGIKKIMLKVHPENTIAKAIYEKSGFVPTGIDSANNNIIYHREL